MNHRRFRFEGWLYGLAFLLALSLRLIELGAMPLADAEAGPALQALQLAAGLKPALGPHPLYILSTTVLFFLYGGGTDFLARLVPALAGSALVLAPILFADRIKPRPAVLLAFFLALDPGLTAISRQAASPILAVASTVFAIGYFLRHEPRRGGIFAALALLSGPAAWAGLVGLALAGMIAQAALRLRVRPVEAPRPPEFVPALLREALVPFLAAFLLVGTLFLIVPNGLSAALGSIPAYLAGWASTSATRLSWLLISLPVYQPFALLLAGLALVRGWRRGSARVIPLGVWWIVSLLLALFTPARQVADLSWSLIPLLALAALELARHLDVPPAERREAAGAVLLTVFLWVFAWLNYSALVWLSYGMPGFDLRLGLLAGSILLLVVSLLLTAFGWSVRVAQVGAIWGLGLTLGAVGLAATFGVMGLRGLSKPELWWLPGIPRHAQLLEATVDDLSEWGLGHDHAVPVVLYGIRPPSLEWVLRERRVEPAQTLDLAAAPELVISGQQGDPALASAYRGQDFTWGQTADWGLARPADWFRWQVHREMPQSGETVILWAREDLFLGPSIPAQP